MLKLFHSFRRDKTGTTAILSALTLLILVGFGAFAIDFSNFYYLKRKQQGAGDIAAIAGAADLSNAARAVTATLARNDYDVASIQSIEIGSYSADGSLAPADRFKPSGNGSGNAVRVTMQTRAPLYLGQIFGVGPARASDDDKIFGGAGLTVRTVSVAAQNSAAEFAIGSRLLKLDGGLLNSLLGGLLGANLSLSVMDYQALATVNLDLFAFSNALATRVNLTGVSYDTLLSGQYRLGDIYGALGDAARLQPSGSAAAAALTAIGQSASSSRQMSLSPLLSLGPSGALMVGGKPPVSAMINALDVASLTAQIANGKRQVQVGLNLNIPGIAAANLQLGIGERPVGSSAVAVGAAGASVHTAQTRLLLSVQLVGSGQAALVNLPLYLELAAGTARLSSISCSPGNPASSYVTLGVTPAVVDAWIGAVSAADFANMMTAPSPGSATLLNLAGLATVTGRAHATIGNLSEKQVGFSYADIQQMMKKTVSTTDYTSSLATKLLGDLQLQINVLGLGIGLPGGLDKSVLAVLQQATAPVDQLLSSLLGALGIGLGQADTWVGGVRCGSGVLVN